MRPDVNDEPIKIDPAEVALQRAALGYKPPALPAPAQPDAEPKGPDGSGPTGIQ